jgi:hypothetical protein
VHASQHRATTEETLSTAWLPPAARIKAKASTQTTEEQQHGCQQQHGQGHEHGRNGAMVDYLEYLPVFGYLKESLTSIKKILVHRQKIPQARYTAKKG